jgi:hypothetical protein
MIITSTRISGGKFYGARPDPYFNLVTLLLPASGANGAQNETFVDGSSNNFTMAPTGNPTQGSFSPFSPNGYSNYFDGTGDYLTTPANSAFAFGTGAFTVEAWVYYSPATVSRTIVGNTINSGGDNSRWILYGDSTGKIWLETWSATLAAGGTALRDGTWNHVCATFDGTTYRVFVNGQIQGTGTTVQNLSSTDGPSIGRNPATGNVITGYISNLRIIKGTAVYTANFTPPTAPLTAIANTSLLTCQSNRFIDNSSNGFALAISGEPNVRPFSPFAPTNRYTTAANGGSAAFDGQGDYITTAAAVNQTAFEFGTGDFTWECWIYPTSNPAGNNRIIGFVTTAGTLQAQLYVSGGNTLTYDQVGATTPYSQTYSQSFNDQWSHIAVSRVSGTSRVFVNGVQLGASFADTKNFAASRFAMATNPTTQIVYYAGYITGVKIVKGTGLYTADFPCPTAPPTATNAELLLNFTNAGIVDAAAKNDLETVGNTTLSTAQSKWGTSSIFFDGTGDWLLGSLAANNIESQLRTGNFTIELWVYLASADVGSARGLVSKGTSNSGYSVSLNSTQKVVFSFTSSSITSTGSIPTNSWVHIAVVRAGTGANLTKIYINGVNDGTGTVSTDFNQTNNLYVGADRVGSSPMKGYMQDLRITRDLARYTENFTPPTAPFPTQ